MRLTSRHADAEVGAFDILRLDDLERRGAVQLKLVDEGGRGLGGDDRVTFPPGCRHLDVRLRGVRMVRHESGDDGARLVGPDAPPDRPARADVRLGRRRRGRRQRQRDNGHGEADAAEDAHRPIIVAR